MRRVGRFRVHIRQRFKTFAGLSRRKDIGRRKYWLAAQSPNAGLMEDRADALRSCGHPFTLGFLDFPPPGDGIGIVEIGHRPVQALAILNREFVKTFAVGRDPFQQLGCCAQAFRQSLFGNSHALVAGRIPSAAGFEQEPGAPFRLVNPDFDQAGGGDVFVILTNVVSLAKSRRQHLAVFA